MPSGALPLRAAFLQSGRVVTVCGAISLPQLSVCVLGLCLALTQAQLICQPELHNEVSLLSRAGSRKLLRTRVRMHTHTHPHMHCFLVLRKSCQSAMSPLGIEQCYFSHVTLSPPEVLFPDWLFGFLSSLHLEKKFVCVSKRCHRTEVPSVFVNSDHSCCKLPVTDGAV